MAIRAAAAKLFCDLDYVISPVSPVVNFPAEFASPLNDPEKPFEHICSTVPWNMAENPAVSIKAATTRTGFPIGVQIIGRRFDDIGVLGMAKAFGACAGRKSRGRRRRRSSALRHSGAARSDEPGIYARSRLRISPGLRDEAGRRARAMTRQE